MLLTFESVNQQPVWALTYFPHNSQPLLVVRSSSSDKDVYLMFQQLLLVFLQSFHYSLLTDKCCQILSYRTWLNNGSLWRTSSGVTTQMKATEQYFPLVMSIMLCKVVLTFKSMDEILKCDHSNESYWAVLCCDAVYYAVQGGSNFWLCVWNPKVCPFKWKLLTSPPWHWPFFQFSQIKETDKGEH